MADFQNFIAQTRAWRRVRQGAKGRQSKGKARLARFEELNNVEYQKRNETAQTRAWRNEQFVGLVTFLVFNVVKLFKARQTGFALRLCANPTATAC
jgi:hypothetical protein